MDAPTRAACINMLPEHRETFITLGAQGRPLFNAMSNEERTAFALLSPDNRKNFIRQELIRMAQDSASVEEANLISLHWACITSPDARLQIIEQDLLDNPHRSLLRVFWTSNRHHAFPNFNYGGPEIDQGGVTRHFITQLFEALCREQQHKLPMTRAENGRYLPELLDIDALSEEDRELLPPEEFGKLSKERQIQCYKGIGAIFARVLCPPHAGGPFPMDITTGAHFHEGTFAMMHALTQADLDALPENFNLDAFPAIYKKLLIVFLKTNYQNLFVDAAGRFIDDAAFLEEVEHLLEGTISERLSNEKGLTAEDASDLLQMSKSKIKAIIIITKSLESNLPAGNTWEAVKEANPNTLREKIEGKLTTEIVLQSLNLQRDAVHLSRKERFLKRWIQEASHESLQKFVWATTGLKTLASNQRLSLRGDGLSVDLLPVFHTCSQAIDLPDYATYEILKEKLEGALASIDGFQLG